MYAYEGSSESIIILTFLLEKLCMCFIFFTLKYISVFCIPYPHMIRGEDYAHKVRGAMFCLQRWHRRSHLREQCLQVLEGLSTAALCLSSQMCRKLHAWGKSPSCQTTDSSKEYSFIYSLIRFLNKYFHEASNMFANCMCRLDTGKA